MIVMDMGETSAASARTAQGAPSPGVVLWRWGRTCVRSAVGLGASSAVIGGAGAEHASCGTWRGTWHLGADTSHFKS